MANQKKQHYVPKMYMRNFANGKLFNLFYIRKNKHITNVPYSDQCKEPYFYGEDLEWEKKFSSSEGKWSDLFKKIIFNDTYDLTPLDHTLIKEFVIFQKSRVMAKRNEYIDMVWETRKATAGLIAKNKLKTTLTDEMLKHLKKDFLDNHSSGIPKTNVEIAEHIIHNIDDLEISVIKYETNNDLIASDNPVIFYNLYNLRDVGLGLAGLLILFPISPKKLIVLYDPKMYKINKFIKLNNEGEVEKLNSMQYIVANEIVFYKTSKTTKNIEKIYQKYKKFRSDFQNRSNNVTFGTEDDKVVVHQENFIDLKYNLYFAKTPLKAEKINFRVKDWIPREKDEEYVERMKNRKMIFSSNQIKLPNPLIPSKLFIYFEKFVFDYWNNKIL